MKTTVSINAIVEDALNGVKHYLNSKDIAIKKGIDADLSDIYSI